MKRREIKFRKWNGVEMYNPHANPLDDHTLSDVNEETMIWMEKTGLTDKNGKEIYEGDVLSVSDSRNQMFSGQIEMIDGSWRVWDNGRNRFWVIAAMQQYHSITIIGNIYETPKSVEP
jgi:uncharacterized phage protein (TIGR01671 family)